MTNPAVNVHATAAVIGTSGFLFVGPSGSGKTMLALSCVAAARHCGLFAALVSDDQVLMSMHNGRAIARRPASIAGLAEIRGFTHRCCRDHPGGCHRFRHSAGQSAL